MDDSSAPVHTHTQTHTHRERERKRESKEAARLGVARPHGQTFATDHDGECSGEREWRRFTAAATFDSAFVVVTKEAVCDGLEPKGVTAVRSRAVLSPERVGAKGSLDAVLVILRKYQR